jgi:TPR repeat protein
VVRILILIGLILGLAGAARAGLDEGLAAYKRGDFGTAHAAWAPLAEAGDREAQYFLGHLYAKGEGVAQDHGLALHWFRAAAAQGDPYGQFALGYLFEHGRGVARDDRAAVRWYRVAAEQGNLTAQNNLGLMYERGRGVSRDYVMAYLWYARAASDSGPDRDKAARNLDQVRRKMTPAQIGAAKRLLNEGAR